MKHILTCANRIEGRQCRLQSRQCGGSADQDIAGLGLPRVPWNAGCSTASRHSLVHHRWLHRFLAGCGLFVSCISLHCLLQDGDTRQARKISSAPHGVCPHLSDCKTCATELTGAQNSSRSPTHLNTETTLPRPLSIHALTISWLFLS